jgi:hypothetical protein
MGKKNKEMGGLHGCAMARNRKMENSKWEMGMGPLK